jgi:hypothetical protein
MIDKKPWGFVETVAEDKSSVSGYSIKRFAINPKKNTELLELGFAEVHVLALSGFSGLITLDGEGIENLDKQFKNPDTIGMGVPSRVVPQGSRFRLMNLSEEPASVLVFLLGDDSWKTVTNHEGTLISE